MDGVELLVGDLGLGGEGGSSSKGENTTFFKWSVESRNIFYDSKRFLLLKTIVNCGLTESEDR